MKVLYLAALAATICLPSFPSMKQSAPARSRTVRPPAAQSRYAAPFCLFTSAPGTAAAWTAVLAARETAENLVEQSPPRRRFYRRVSDGDPWEPAAKPILTHPEEAKAAGPPHFDALLEDGAVVGELVLGETTRDRALWLYSRPASEAGPDLQPHPQSLDAVSRVRRIVKIPTSVFRPWRSAQTLLFDEDQRLVAVIAHNDPLEGMSLSRAFDQFPHLKDTGLASKTETRFREFAAEIAPSVSLILVLDSSRNKVAAVAYVWDSSEHRAQSR